MLWNIAKIVNRATSIIRKQFKKRKKEESLDESQTTQRKLGSTLCSTYILIFFSWLLQKDGHNILALDEGEACDIL